MTSVEPPQIAAQVRAQIATYASDYRAAVRPTSLVGTALPVEQIERDLATMREALVDPHWLEAEVGITPPGVSGWNERCLVVARHPGGYLLAYIPSQDQYTVLREYEPGKFGSFGLDGDAVGAFISI